MSSNTFSMDIERMMDPDLTANVSAGVARVTVKQARDLPNMEALGSLFNQNNVSDPFVGVCLDDGEIVATTKVIDDSLSPIWNETFFVIVPPSNENLTFQVFHESAIGTQFIGQINEPIQNEKIDGCAHFIFLLRY